MGEEGETYTLDQYKEMSAVQRKKLKKEELLNLLEESIESTVIERKLDEILEELKSIREKSEKCENEIRRIDQTVNDHSKILAAQQKFMEQLDGEKRAKHLIVLGLKEERNMSDLDKFNDIVRVIGLKPGEDVKVENTERLGTINENDQNKVRPMKVTLESMQMRSQMLKNASKLKDQEEGSAYKRIFLKRDTHPDVRAEEKRLYEVFKAERDKPENVDKEVLFDRKNRVVTVNRDEIDRFRLFSSFR